MSEGNAYVLRIDGPLLRRQRRVLQGLSDAILRGVPYVPESNDEKDLMEGISALLDVIADQAHDRYGID